MAERQVALEIELVGLLEAIDRHRLRVDQTSPPEQSRHLHLIAEAHLRVADITEELRTIRQPVTAPTAAGEAASAAIDAARAAVDRLKEQSGRSAEVIRLHREPGAAAAPSPAIPADSDEPGPPITDSVARHVLDRIHAALVVPFVWGPDTAASIWAILDAAGYRLPDAETACRMEHRAHAGDSLVDLLALWRPDRLP